MSDYIINSFQVPNVLVDELMAIISPNALKCYLAIIKNKNVNPKSVSKYTKINLKEVEKAILELKEVRIIYNG